MARSAPTSEPAAGSVRFMVPVHSPATSFSAKVAFCASVPCAWINSTAPWVNSGQSASDMLAPFHISPSATATAQGSPPPPNSGSNGTPFQPPAMNCW